MTQEIQERVQKHEHKIETLEFNVNRVLNALEKNTEKNGELVNKFSVYISKHDDLKQTVDSINKKVTNHGEVLAAHKPVVDGVRGIVWKIFGSTLIGMGGVAALVAAIIKLS